MGTDSMISALMKRENRDPGTHTHTHTHTHTEGHVETETEIGVMQPQAKDCWQPPEARRGRAGSYLRTFRERAQPCQHLVSDVWPPEL